MKKEHPDFIRPKRADGKVWKGKHMDIYTEPGTMVVFHGAFPAQVNWGGSDDPNTVLTMDAEYKLEYTEIHGSYTHVKLVGIGGMFPSGAFHAVGAEGWKEE